MAFRFNKIVSLGAKSIWMHLLRSMLTALGIIFGVASVIAMLAIGEGASQQAQEQIARLGSRNIIVKTVKPPENQTNDGSEESLLEYGLRYSDADRFRQTIPDIDVVVPIRKNQAQASYLNKRVPVEVVGTVSWFSQMNSINLVAGRFLTEMDMEYTKSVCVVDGGVVEKLYGFDESLGQEIKINGHYYTIVGITEVQASESEESSGGVAGLVYMPITTSKAFFGE